MQGLILAIIAGLIIGSIRLVHKHILKDEDSLVYSCAFHLLGGLIFLPLLIIYFELPSSPKAWILAAVSTIAWAVAVYSGFCAYKILQVSLRTILSKTRPIFAIIISFVVFREAFHYMKVVGTLIIFLGIVVAFYNKKLSNDHITNKGIMFGVLAGFFGAIAMTADKYALEFFNINMYLFMIYFLPGLLVLPFALQRKKEIKSLFTNKIKPTILAVIGDCIAYIFVLNALKRADASIVIPVIEISVIISVIGGVVFYKEDDNLIRKIIATFIVVLGIVILGLVA